MPLRVARLLATGLRADLDGSPEAAVGPLRAAVELERDHGWLYRAACLETELARVLNAAGATAEAARERAAAVLGPLAVVNPY